LQLDVLQGKDIFTSRTIASKKEAPNQPQGGGIPSIERIIGVATADG